MFWPTFCSNTCGQFHWLNKLSSEAEVARMRARVGEEIERRRANGRGCVMRSPGFAM
jgi:hypothetical protein